MRELVITEILTIANLGRREPSDGRWDPERYNSAYEYAYRLKNKLGGSLTKAQRSAARKLVLTPEFFEGVADEAVLSIFIVFHSRYNQQR